MQPTPIDAAGTEATRPPRPLWLRSVFAVLWFVPLYFVSNILIGAVIGAIAGATTTSYDQGFAAGQAASQAFFQQWGLLVLALQIALTVLLSWRGWLPGTRRSNGH